MSKHSKEKEMKYLAHFLFASKYGFVILKHGFQLIINGIIPCLFKDAGEKLFVILVKKFKKSELRESMKNFDLTFPSSYWLENHQYRR